MTPEQEEFMRKRGFKPASQPSQPDRELIITTSDGGQVYEVNGKLYFTSGGYATSDQEVIRKIIQNERKGGASPREMQESQIRQEIIGQAPVAARASKVMQGVPFVGEGMDEAVSALSPTAGKNVRLLQGAMQQENPVESTLLRMAGGLSGAPLEGAAAGSAGMSFLRGGLTGTAEGATSGFLSGQEGNRLQSAGQDALLGGLVGGVAKTAGDALQQGAAVALNRSPNVIADEFGVSIEAAKIIQATFQAGGNAEEALNNIRRAGQAGMLADAGMDVQVFLDAMMRMSPSAAREGTQAISGRLEEQGRRLNTQMDETFGVTPEGSGSALKRLQDRSAPARGRLYDVAYSKPIDYEDQLGRDIIDVLDRIPEQYKKRAVERANEAIMMDKNITDPTQIKIDFDAEGNMVFTQQPTVRQLDELKKALQEEGMAIKGQSPTDYRSGRYMSAGRDVRDATTAAVPIYGRAVEAGGDNLREKEIFEAAELILSPRMTREQFSRIMDGATSFEQTAAKTGARNAIDDTLANARQALNSADPAQVNEARKLLTMASSRSSQEKLRMLLGYEEAQKFIRSMDEMRAAFGLRAATSQGSQTAARMNTAEMLGGVLEPNVLTRAQRGEVLLTGKQVLQALTGTTDERLAINNQEVLREAAGVLTGKTGNRTAEEALKIINNAIEGKQITAAQRKIVEKAVNLMIPATREGAESYEENR
jgi:hypothetical protein